VAKEIGANMIILGTHGKVGVQHLVGSYAIKVITSSSVPVIVVQERAFGEGYKNIVLPLDISLESKQKVKWAVYLAKNFNSTVHIFTMNETDEFLARNIKNNLEQIKSILEQNNINYTAKIAYEKGGSFVKQVIHYADSIKADMITVMTAPDRLLPTFIVDTKDEQTIFNNSKIPVLCLNPLDVHIQVIGL
jgi:nucleotide-binding universal stress UspA family protein